MQLTHMDVCGSSFIKLMLPKVCPARLAGQAGHVGQAGGETRISDEDDMPELIYH